MLSWIKRWFKRIAGEHAYQALQKSFYAFLSRVRRWKAPAAGAYYASKIARSENLPILGKYHGTDKHEAVHSFAGMSYLDIYELYLRPYKNEPIALLEIGINDGESLRMWKSYFPKAEIFGIDIDPRCRSFAEERIRIAIGSQDDEAFLGGCFGGDRRFDVILDDGSHVNKMTLASFQYLFYHRLRPGGLYILEDLHCSYDKLQTEFDVRSNWPGMKYNDPAASLDNDRRDMDGFFLSKICDLDHRKGEIQFIHFWSMTCVIKRIQ
jgi:spermidine synthase